MARQGIIAGRMGWTNGVTGGRRAKRRARRLSSRGVNWKCKGCDRKYGVLDGERVRQNETTQPASAPQKSMVGDWRVGGVGGRGERDACVARLGVGSAGLLRVLTGVRLALPSWKPVKPGVGACVPRFMAAEVCPRRGLPSSRLALVEACPRRGIRAYHQRRPGNPRADNSATPRHTENKAGNTPSARAEKGGPEERRQTRRTKPVKCTHFSLFAWSPRGITGPAAACWRSPVAATPRSLGRDSRGRGGRAGDWPWRRASLSEGR
ncbi:hypothetical protein F4802DRAFT_278075 [Xylaria palmicola]|nr:hypothetical protein F4802DRAFT_278075 [Xylaria palmicola]